VTQPSGKASETNTCGVGPASLFVRHAEVHMLNQQTERGKRKRTRKEKNMLFSDHNGSLLRAAARSKQRGYNALASQQHHLLLHPQLEMSLQADTAQ